MHIKFTIVLSDLSHTTKYILQNLYYYRFEHIHSKTIKKRF